jgi:hypothetical protein
MRLQRGISFVLLALASFIVVLELIRHGHGAERWILGLLLLVILQRFAQL